MVPGTPFRRGQLRDVRGDAGGSNPAHLEDEDEDEEVKNLPFSSTFAHKRDKDQRCHEY